MGTRNERRGPTRVAPPGFPSSFSASCSLILSFSVRLDFQRTYSRLLVFPPRLSPPVEVMSLT
jgi:hypothetical protein